MQLDNLTSECKNMSTSTPTIPTTAPMPSSHQRPIQRSASDTMLATLTHKTSDTHDGLSVTLSVDDCTIAKPADVRVSWDGQPSDLPLLFQLVSVGLVGAVNGCAKVRQRAGRHARRLPFVGVSRLQTLMHLGRLRSSSSSSVPETCGDQMIGLNFADESEANSFNTAISDRLAAKLKKREERKRMSEQQQQQQQQQRPTSVHSTHQQQNVSHLHHQPQQQQQPQPPQQPKPHYVSPYTNNDLRKKGTKKGNKKTTKLSKNEIGMPMDFKHITHVGFNPDTGFSQFNMDDKLEGFFNMVGVSQKQLSDSRTREFIYDFIEKNGGVEKAIQETQRHSSRGSPPPPIIPSSAMLPPPPAKSSVPPPPPPTVPSHTPTQGTRAAPPPPPPRNTNHGHPPPPPPPGFAPPPPPPHSRSPMPPPPGQVMAGKKTTPLPPLPPPTTNHHQTPPPPPPTSTIPSLQHHHPHHHSTKAAAPPPPPPPAPPANGMAPPPPPPLPAGPPGGGAATDTRSALLEQIRAGSTHLKKVEPVERPAATDSRSQLMDQIRTGFSLKPVEDGSDSSGPKSAEPKLEGLALDLHRALAMRATAIQSDDDDDSDSEEDDEWDDDET
ncbi:actin nucleation-promoting factor WASL-like isoform X2 [Eriocheir sinensis]|uniref:actin nucleation-promoting factor WASL-like isoform X2 n=1 Tax=Eriocheir sinensis TaxID=95602 RepID=UPI0021CA188A|nr:actin nucleation-promoting factor WASL-like isoform X2 [Eriocheir sinensis]